MRRRGSVAEHLFGKEEVVGPIPTGGLLFMRSLAVYA
jgi:hypothetical protein